MCVEDGAGYACVCTAGYWAEPGAEGVDGSGCGRVSVKSEQGNLHLEVSAGKDVVFFQSEQVTTSVNTLVAEQLAQDQALRSADSRLSQRILKLDQKAATSISDLDTRTANRISDLDRKVASNKNALDKELLDFQTKTARDLGLVDVEIKSIKASAGTTDANVNGNKRDISNLQTFVSAFEACSAKGQTLIKGRCEDTRTKTCPDVPASYGTMKPTRESSYAQDVYENLPGVTYVMSCSSGWIPNDGRRTTCKTDGKWSRPLRSCNKWRTCKAGEYISKQGTPSSDRVCKACPSGTFNPSTTTSRTSCTKFRTCNKNHYVSYGGSSTRDRTCSRCPGGYVQPKDGFTGTKCTRYSENYQRPSSCRASSEHNHAYRCGNSYNGRWHDGGWGAWATRYQTRGAWIYWYFNRKMTLGRFDYMQRNCWCEIWRDVQLEFRSGSRLIKTLRWNMPHAGNRRFQYRFDPIGDVDNVRFYAHSQWTGHRYNPGFNEIAFYGV